MTQRRGHVITPCSARATGCSSFAPGHNTHTVQATLAGTTPRAWRAAVVEAVDGYCLTLTYVDAAESVVVWHHLALGLLTDVGSVVRLHDRQPLLEIDAHWYSVAVSETAEAEACYLNGT